MSSGVYSSPWWTKRSAAPLLTRKGVTQVTSSLTCSVLGSLRAAKTHFRAILGVFVLWKMMGIFRPQGLLAGGLTVGKREVMEYTPVLLSTWTGST